MSVRFAAANNPVRRIGWRATGRGLIAPALARAVNDNGDDIGGRAQLPATFDPLLTDALRHFAVHGLGAVEAALDAAEQACADGDGNTKDRWLAITQMFDRRRAAAAGATSTPG